MIYNDMMMDITDERINGYKRAVEILWLAVILLLPLFFNPASHQAFYLNKVLLFQFIVLLMLALSIGDWIYRGYNCKARLREAIKSPLRLAVLVFAGIAIITTLMSITPGISFWGGYTRKAGLLTLLCGVLFFLIVSGYMHSRHQVYRLLYALLISSAIVSVIGILQSFFPTILFGYNPGSRVYSTMGNALALSVFLTMVMPFNLALIYLKWNEKQGKKGILVLSALLILFILNFWCLWLTQYSIIILLYVIAPVVFILLFGVIKNRKLILIPALLISLVLIIVAAVVLIPLFLHKDTGDNVLDRRVELITGEQGLGLSTLAKRVQFWKGTIDLIRESPEIPLSHDIFSPIRTFTGYGLETYRITFQGYFPENVQEFRGELFVPLDRPHNHYLYLAASMGLLGLLSFLSVLVVFFYLAFRFIRKSRLESDKVLIIALVASMTGYMADVFFNPSTISAELLFWLLPGLLLVIGKFTLYPEDREPQLFCRESENDGENSVSIPNRGRYYVSLGCSILLLTGIFCLMGRPFFADMYLQRGLNLSNSNIKQSIDSFEKAITLEPGEATYRSFLGQYTYFIARQQSNSNVKQSFLDLSTFELEKAHVIERYIDSRYYTLADVYLYWALHGADDKFERALLLYEQASQLSPRNVLIYNRWALALLLKGDVEQAEEKLDIARKIDPEWVGNSMILALISYNEGQIDEAARVLTSPIGEDSPNLRYFIEMCFYLSTYDMVGPLDEVLTAYSDSEPEEWVPYAMRGITSYCLNIPDRSLNEFNTAMSLVPDEYAGELFKSTLTLAGYSSIYKGMLSAVAPAWRVKLSKTKDSEKYLNRLDELSGSLIESET